MAAREQHSREDLLAEATGLVQRIALEIAREQILPVATGQAASGESADSIRAENREVENSTLEVVFGFRRDGAWSVFLGEDPVWQFNSQGELRRVYWSAELFKAKSGRLQRVVRQNVAGRLVLEATDLSDAQSQHLLQAATEQLLALQRCLHSGEYVIRGQVPESGDVLERSQSFLATLIPLRIAQRPHSR